VVDIAPFPVGISAQISAGFQSTVIEQSRRVAAPLVGELRLYAGPKLAPIGAVFPISQGLDYRSCPLRDP